MRAAGVQVFSEFEELFADELVESRDITSIESIVAMEAAAFEPKTGARLALRKIIGIVRNDSTIGDIRILDVCDAQDRRNAGMRDDRIEVKG